MAHDPILAAHKQWIGYLQPVGLVVAPHALLAAQAVVSEHVGEPQQRLKALPRPVPLRALAQDVLGWRPEDLEPPPESLSHPLPEYGETLRPTFAVRDASAPPERPWLLLVQDLSPGTSLDADPLASSHGWDAPPQAKFERLLRETNVPIGLLHNGELLRLVYAPRGETSGHLTFPLEFMSTVAGRQTLGACLMLLGEQRLFSESDNRRLPSLLAESRKYQNEVSTRLAEQVLGALLSLLRGFQAADEASRGQLLGALSRDEPQHIYGGLLTVLLRLVFLLYAEDRGLMPGEPTWSAHYSVTGLYLRLRDDAGRHPDTMHQRFGAWSALLSLFRLVYTGGTHDRLHVPARHGALFDPDSYPFLEGRARGDAWQQGEHREAPRVPDGVLWHVLQSLLVLDGERLSYRSLDVEQIGSVYESMMGFNLERARGPSLAVRPHHVVVDLAVLLSQKPDARAKHLKDVAGCDLTGPSLAALKTARSPDDAVAALGRKTSPRTPNIIPAGSLYLQPGEERRKSGSHYTPRTLTSPIVRTTLRPILEALGDRPTPAQILDLKICDPAMGSGAFLVEACRQLGDHLVHAWDLHKNTPSIPPDEDPLLHARRLVAQRCLYGVDKNPFAVDLAKLSLWLVTLAKDHPFTFLDHAFKNGDSLVGLTKSQIFYFRWDDKTDSPGPLFDHFTRQVGKATSLRREIHDLGDEQEAAKREALRAADDATYHARLIGDALISAFFSEDSDKKRVQHREELKKSTIVPAQKGDAKAISALRDLSETLRNSDKPVRPFHWEIEFPEVFDRENPGFDGIVGNPPFLGGARLSGTLGTSYLQFLQGRYPHSGGQTDLVAYFFRRAFSELTATGSLGMIATNTIAQGDTRSAGIGWICKNGGMIYAAERRFFWPGIAAVIVSVLHITKNAEYTLYSLDDQILDHPISPYLISSRTTSEPRHLAANLGIAFKGAMVYGLGFVFDDTTSGSNSLDEMHRLLKSSSRNQQCIFPYIGGSEVNSSPTHAHYRYIINFGDMEEREARKWPDLMNIVEQRVKPERDTCNRESYKKHWWQYGEKRVGLTAAASTRARMLVSSQTAKYRLFTWLPTGMVYDQKLVIFAVEQDAALTVLQSRIHEAWSLFLGSSMKDDPVYTPSDCFQTFPLPTAWEQAPPLTDIGRRYHEFRATLMVRNNEGLTATYNRFHDPDEQSPDILKLRELHAEMDRAVLTAYGWTDLAERATCEFRLDYEEDEEPTDEAPRARAKKKPWRYRWPQEFHDEVLARLLDLNQQRAEEERLAGAAANTGTGATTKPAPASTRKKLTPRVAPPILALPFATETASEAPPPPQPTPEAPAPQPAAPPAVTRRARENGMINLELILCDLFPEDDRFRQWVRDVEPGRPLWADLPGRASSLRILIHEAIKLFENHGIMTPDLLGRLRREHPSHASQFHAVALDLFDHSDNLDTIRMVVPDRQRQTVTTQLDALFTQRDQRIVEGLDIDDITRQIDALNELSRKGKVQPGDFLGDGRFCLTEVTSSGGYATVWKATDRHIDTPAAVKVLHPHIVDDETDLKRFIVGSRVMAKLNHPHIARIRHSATSENGFYYYAMDHLPNGDLHRAVTRKQVNLRQRLAIVADVAEALDFAHRRDIIHRDIKPANILIDADHHGVMTDFDLARAPGTRGNTRTGTMLGTHYFAAPEARFPAKVGTWSDVYSLGMVLLFCLVGEDFDRLEANLYDPEGVLDPLPAPVPLKSLIRRCLVERPEERTITMSAIHQTLLRHLNT